MKDSCRHLLRENESHTFPWSTTPEGEAAPLPWNFHRIADVARLGTVLWYVPHRQRLISLKEECRYQELDQTEQTFENLAQKWRDETVHISSSTDRVLNRYYQQIIGMGRPAVPMILRHLKREGPNHWYWALASITRENPATKADAGNIRRLRDAWIRWGEERGIL